MNKNKIALFLSYFAKTLLLIMAISLLIFALLSGAENSWSFRNVPNALPWVLLLIFVCVAFRWQIWGGILVILFGIFTILFFSALEFIWILFIISLPVIILGSILTWYGFFDKKINNKK
jgi:hypothetical protein